MTKGVFGSKNQAAWVWTAGDTDSDLLTDDDQFGRKCSERFADDLQKGAVRSNLWGTGLLLPNIDDLEVV